MASNRIGRINEEIQRELSALLRTVKDPRLQNGLVTITHVDTTSDLRYAKIYISALDKSQVENLLKTLCILQSRSNEDTGRIIRSLWESLSAAAPGKAGEKRKGFLSIAGSTFSPSLYTPFFISSNSFKFSSTLLSR